MAGPGRLIDEGLSFYEASLAGKAERYGRGETPHTIHVWWARRPHSAMRALVYAALR
ncbi:PF06634 family protein, partial [Bordetella bronchiseptica MBORD632]